MCHACFTIVSLVSPAHTQRLLKLQSILRRAPSYRTLELQLIEWQERELFEYFVVVSLKKKPTKNSFSPEVTYQFPKVNTGQPPQHWRIQYLRHTLAFNMQTGNPVFVVHSAHAPNVSYNWKYRQIQTQASLAFRALWTNEESHETVFHLRQIKATERENETDKSASTAILKRIELSNIMVGLCTAVTSSNDRHSFIVVAV